MKEFCYIHPIDLTEKKTNNNLKDLNNKFLVVDKQRQKPHKRNWSLVNAPENQIESIYSAAIGWLPNAIKQGALLEPSQFTQQ